MDPLQKSPQLAPNDILTKEMLHNHQYWVSTKLDGIRCLVLPDRRLVTRTFKNIPNERLYSRYSEIMDLAEDTRVIFDCEIWSPRLSFNDIQSIVMTKKNTSSMSIPVNLQLYCFDCISEEDWKRDICIEPFRQRQDRLFSLLDSDETTTYFPMVAQQSIYTWETLETLFNDTISLGGEGLIVRNPDSPYKHGRATVKQDIIYKMKSFDTVDAKVVGYYPLEAFIEGREEDTDNFGHASTKKNKQNSTTIEELGGLVLQLSDGSTVCVGSGFNYREGDKDRIQLWKDRESLLHKFVEIKYQTVPEGQTPRCPIFIRWRDDKNGF